MPEFASELRDESLYNGFVALNALHQNFYDEVFPRGIFPDYRSKAIQPIARSGDLAGNTSNQKNRFTV